MIMAGHQDQKFVCYPITRRRRHGRALINWIAELRVADGRPAARRTGTAQADPGDFRRAFADWRFGWLDVPALIGGAERVYEYPMVDRDPLDALDGGRVTLLGDAAHPMYPIGSNGASQAILDAGALAESWPRATVRRGAGALRGRAPPGRPAAIVLAQPRQRARTRDAARSRSARRTDSRTSRT